MSLPPSRWQRMSLMPTMGWATVVLEPITNRQPARASSSNELVMAPLPNEVARPATVGPCQRRAQ